MRCGRGLVTLRRPLGAAVLEPPQGRPVADVEAAVESALASPIGGPSLEQALHGRNSVVILVPDKTRHAHTPPVLRVLLRRLAAAGIEPSGVTILVAAGDHPRHTPEELAEVAGPGLPDGVRVVEHRAVDEADCVEVGRTPRGTPVRVNRLVATAPGLILTGAVSHHYFAGFGGGPKAAFPGAAARSAIRANHGLVIADGDKDPRACAGRLDGNPVHEDLCDAVSLLAPSFLVNVVNDGDDRALAFFAGHWRAAHRAGCAFLERVAGVSAEPGSFDLLAVSAGGYPHDLNLVQSHKAIDRCAPLLADGGRMLILAECAQGFGDPDLEQRLLEADEPGLLRVLSTAFVVKAHTALCLLRKARRLRLAIAGQLAPGPLSAAGMQLAGEPATAWERLLAKTGGEARIGFVPAGHFIVPGPRPVPAGED
jgi:nickel-dependent lactate racemase